MIRTSQTLNKLSNPLKLYGDTSGGTPRQAIEMNLIIKNSHVALLQIIKLIPQAKRHKPIKENFRKLGQSQRRGSYWSTGNKISPLLLSHISKLEGSVINTMRLT